MKLVLFSIGILAFNSAYTMNQLPFKADIIFIAHKERVNLRTAYEKSGVFLGVPVVFPRKENDSLAIVSDSRNDCGAHQVFRITPISSVDSSCSYQLLPENSIKTSFTQSFSPYPLRTIKVLVNNNPVRLPLKKDEKISMIIKQYQSPPKIHAFLDTVEDEKSIISSTQRLLMHELSTENDAEGLNSCRRELEKHDFRDTFKLTTGESKCFSTFILCVNEVSKKIKQRIPKVIYDNSIIKPYFLKNRPEVIDYKNTISTLIEYNKKLINEPTTILTPLSSRGVNEELF